MNDTERVNCANNIKLLAKRQGKKMKDVEKHAQVSSGFIARTALLRSRSRLTPNALADIAQYLNVTVEFLMTADLTALSPMEEYLLKFLTKLEEDTLKGEMSWHLIKKSFLQHIPYEEVKQGKHPLLRVGKPVHVTVAKKAKVKTDLKGILLPIEYNPGEDIGATFSGDWFSAAIDGDATLYLTSVCYLKSSSPKATIFELYLLKKDALEPKSLCRTFDCNNSIVNVLKRLHEIVVKTHAHTILDDNTISILDAYLNKGKAKGEKS